MEKTRLEKVARLIQKEMSLMLQDSVPYTGGGILTVTRVSVTPDLQIARIHISIFGLPDKKAALEQLKLHGPELRYQLGVKIRHQVRIIPQLQFFLDDSLDYIERIDKLLNQ